MYKINQYLWLLLLAYPCIWREPSVCEIEEEEERLPGCLRQEVKKHCKRVKPGKGRLLKCVRKLEASKSKRCRSYLAKRKKRKARLAALGASKGTARGANSYKTAGVSHRFVFEQSV